MALPKRYEPATSEPELQAFWQEAGIYHFRPEAEGPIYAIDTPPPTVSGHLHLGHVYSFSHTDFLARFWRMNGYNVYYPMGYDDDGLPTERLVEKWRGVTAREIGRQAFIKLCLEIGEETEPQYEALWKRLGLSVDWRYTYRTIDEHSQRISQRSFVELYRKGLVYRREAPAIWCPECRTSIAQAELNDLERESEFIALAFGREDGGTLPIATTRPELLPACVAIFVHPDDARYASLVGQQARVPLFGQAVPILADPAADPQKGTGAVMCCTFGDVTDVDWWYTHHLPLKVVIGRDGRLTEAAGAYAGLTTEEARRQIVAALEARGLVLGREPIAQSVRVHERCDTPVEYIVTQQWFIRVLDCKQQLLDFAEPLIWHPAHMKARYREWVENLRWDWCISRERAFGVPFPVWYCSACGEVLLADEAQLPVNPMAQQPARPCACGSTSFTPEEDVMDVWATASMTPQIAGQQLTKAALYEKVFPFSLRPQAHEIIRTWAFYTIVKSYHHFGILPWKEVAISGWGLAPGGSQKISKSRGGGPMAPKEMIERYSADAVRYWTASTGFGKDTTISEEKIQLGAKLVTKLWNVARFSERFLHDYRLPSACPRQALSTADRWMLSRTQRLIRRVTELLQGYDYAAAKSEIETFFWGDLADNYLEMAKGRLYNEGSPVHAGARYTLFQTLLTVTKLFAPFLPYITETIYQGLFAEREGQPSVHLSRWPVADEALIDAAAEEAGAALIEIATAVRRYKSEQSLALNTELERLHLATEEPALATALQDAAADLVSITRARRVEVAERLDAGLERIQEAGSVAIALARLAQ
ncbi:MAG TPA: valine--tRNA ligase [Ktedonobacterales bacterium]|nr:valine--tRNA ligase [Ktedonobacterales bacterium]